MLLITGANGYLGGYVLRNLVQQNATRTTRGLIRSSASAGKLKDLGIEPVIGDVTDVNSLDAACQGVDTLIHLAAVNRDKGMRTMRNINQQGTINVVDAAKRAGVKHIITCVGLGASSSKPYPLAQTQGTGIEYLMQSGVPYTILEPSVIFGAGDEFLNTLAGLARVPPIMIVPGDGKTKFQPIAAQDVATCLVKSIDMPAVINKRLQVCGSEVLSLEAIIDAILAEMQLKRIKVHMPVAILKIAVDLMDKLLPKPPVTPSLLAQLGVDNTATDNATQKVFGVTPIKLLDGIGFVKEMTLGRLISRTLGRADYR